MALTSVAELVEQVKPCKGQDVILKYRVRTDKTLLVDETITGWSLVWVLFVNVDDASPTIIKTSAGGIAIATPYAYVTIPAAAMDELTAGVEYGMMLWRNEGGGDKYPLTGVGIFDVQPAPALA